MDAPMEPMEIDEDIEFNIASVLRMQPRQWENLILALGATSENDIEVEMNGAGNSAEPPENPPPVQDPPPQEVSTECEIDTKDEKDSQNTSDCESSSTVSESARALALSRLNHAISSNRYCRKLANLLDWYDLQLAKHNKNILRNTCNHTGKLGTRRVRCAAHKARRILRDRFKHDLEERNVYMKALQDAVNTFYP